MQRILGPFRDEIVVTATSRIAILGLYNSGSTVLAGMLHRMGVNMGGPFWMTSEDGHPDNFYESWALSRQLRCWWNEPTGTERIAADDRIRYLQSWALVQQAERPDPLGAKHPLLSFSAFDLVAAWGPATRFIRAARPLDESIAGLQRRSWFPGFEVVLQTRIWEALEAFDRSHEVISIDWNRAKVEPAWAASELAQAVGLNPNDEQLRYAASLVQPAAPVTIAA